MTLHKTIVSSFLLFPFLILSSCATNTYNQKLQCDDISNVLDQRFVQVFAGLNQIERVASGFLLEPDIVVTAFHVIDRTNLIFVYHPLKDQFIQVSYTDFEIEDDIALLYLDTVFESVDLDIPTDLSNIFSLNTNVIMRAFIPNIGISDVNAQVSRVYQGIIGDIIELSARLEGGGSGAPILTQNCELLGIITSHTRRNETKSFGITTHAIPIMVERGIFHPVRFLPSRFVRNPGTEHLPPRIEYYLSLTAQSWIFANESGTASDLTAILILQLRNNSNVTVNNLQFSVVLLDSRGNSVDTSEFTITQTLRSGEATIVQVEFSPDLMLLYSQDMLNQFSIIFKTLRYSLEP